MKKIILLFFLPFILNAGVYPDKPSNYVTDEVGVLSLEQQSTINRKLRSFEDSTSNQIFVLIAKSLDGNNLDVLCQEIFHKWKIGKQGKNNGVLIAVFIDDHKFRIHTGYGLEGALPDVLTKRIQDEDMRPHFKEEDYYTGIDAGIDRLIYYSKNEYKPGEEGTTDITGWVLGYMFNVLLFIAFVAFLFRKNPKKPRSTSAKTIWLIAAVIFLLIPCLGAIGLFIFVALVGDFKTRGGGTYSSGSSSYDSSSSWSSADSSDSGSSFDGGGGGDSGGGGSSSDW
jgi:uncharacterized protein